MASMPPDLDRLGEQLASAAGKTLARRQRRSEQRRRMTIAGIVGAIAFATMTPASLGPAVRQLAGSPLATAAVSYVPPGCDHPRGSGFMLPRCEPADPAVPHRPYAWR
jgi:hypothetical protein